MYNGIKSMEFCLLKMKKDCFKESVQRLVGTYARPNLKTESDISINEETLYACKVITLAMNSVQRSKLLGTCQVPFKLSHVQTFPPHIANSLSNVFVKWNMFEGEM